MTPEIAAMMRVNLTNRADQMDALATKAKSDDDAELFRRGAEKYRRLLGTLPLTPLDHEPTAGIAVQNPPPSAL
jgi:hypothetical protein